jgi:hypothetical protein
MMPRMLWAVPGHLVLLSVFFWWTGFSDASRSQVLLSVAVAILWFAAFAFLQWKIFAGAKWEAVARPKFWAAIALFAASLVAANLIVHWIPNITGLGWQLASIVLRFSLAWLLVNTAWCSIAWQASLPPPEQSTLAVDSR